MNLSRPLPGDRIAIAVDRWTEPFWVAARAHKLVVCMCRDCGEFRMPPTAYCPQCLSQAVDWSELPGTGTVYSYTVCRRSPVDGFEDFLYIPAVIDLDGGHGARLISNVIDISPDDVTIGLRVKVDWLPISDGWRIPIFRNATCGVGDRPPEAA